MYSPDFDVAVAAYLRMKIQRQCLKSLLKVHLHGRHSSLELILLERRHYILHDNASPRVRLHDVAGAHSCLNDAWVRGVDQYIWVGAVEVLRQVFCVEDAGQLRATV